MNKSISLIFRVCYSKKLKIYINHGFPRKMKLEKFLFHCGSFQITEKEDYMLRRLSLEIDHFNIKSTTKILPLTDPWSVIFFIVSCMEKLEESLKFFSIKKLKC